MASILEILSSSQALKRYTTGLIAVAMFLFCAYFAIPFLVDLPDIQIRVLQAIKLAAGLMVILGALHIFPLIQHLKNVKAGISPLFPRQKSESYQPWPAHSNPVANRAGWGPIETDYEVGSKKTRLHVDSKYDARQTASRTRIGFTFFYLLIGLALAAFPIVMNALVYEITPPEIESLQKLADQTWPLFALCSIAAFITTSVMFLSRMPLAEFDIARDTGSVRFTRCFGFLDKFLKPERQSFRVSEVAGFQLAYHRSKTFRRNNRRVCQYELILVLNDSSRHLLTKGSRHRAVLKDAITIAKFLGVHVWDRSGYYQPNDPEFMSQTDPVLQPL